jgi:hypothetical protein
MIQFRKITSNIMSIDLSLYKYILVNIKFMKFPYQVSKRHSYKNKAKSYKQTISELDLYVLHKNVLSLKAPSSGEVT